MSGRTPCPAPPELFRLLLEAYGPQGWWPVADTPRGEPYHDVQGRRGRPPRLDQRQQWEVMVGALLTQNTAWRNVELALARLRAAELMGLEALARAEEAVLADAIRPSGYYNQKARRLQGLARHLLETWSGELPSFLYRSTGTVRSELLALKGLGPETADSILVYAGNAHHAVFVVDAYAYRLFQRLGTGLPTRDYNAHQAYVEGAGWDRRGPNLPSGRPTAADGDRDPYRMEPLTPDSATLASRSRLTYLFNELHALVVQHGKRKCTARDPRCDGCPLLKLCQQGQAGPARSRTAPVRGPDRSSGQVVTGNPSAPSGSLTAGTFY